MPITSATANRVYNVLLAWNDILAWAVEVAIDGLNCSGVLDDCVTSGMMFNAMREKVAMRWASGGFHGCKE